MKSLRALLRFLIRLVVVWLADAVSLLVTASILPGITIEASADVGRFSVAISAALVLGIVNLFIRPIILLLARSLGFIAILLIGLFVNAIALMITANLIPELQISSWWYAFLGGLIFSVINTIITNLMTIDDDNSFYAGLIERKARKEPIFKETAGEGQGVVMLEIDGLSYHHMQKALAEGYMPTLKSLADEQGYKLWQVETGVPSMTSSCQAGILYGDNYDIPSFRWFDRDLNRFIVSQMDAGLLDKRYSKGQGLVRGGSSIGNMLNGDALKSIFVIATMKQASKEEARQRAQDIYLLMLNPYFFVRSVIFVFADAITEVLQYARQVIRKVEPRLNRLHNGYPLMRAGLTAFLRTWPPTSSPWTSSAARPPFTIPMPAMMRWRTTPVPGPQTPSMSSSASTASSPACSPSCTRKLPALTSSSSSPTTVSPSGTPSCSVTISPCSISSSPNYPRRQRRRSHRLG